MGWTTVSGGESGAVESYEKIIPGTSAQHAGWETKCNKQVQAKVLEWKYLDLKILFPPWHSCLFERKTRENKNKMRKTKNNFHSEITKVEHALFHFLAMFY